MAIVYLEPQDLTAAQTSQLLAFMNQAQSAVEIARAVDLPGEPDIGLRLAQRLLDGRAALGGQYSSLEQLLAVPLIGPERFTDLCVALLGLNRQQWFNPAESGVMPQQPWISRLDQLQSQLDALGKISEGVLLELQCQSQPAWLGQPLTLRLRVQDLRGRPLPNRRLTLQASHGILEVAHGFAVQRGRAVTARTGADGSVILTLRDQTIEPLGIDQQAALEQALTQFDATADTPQQLKNAFSALAEAYQHERNQALRSALDIYARQWKSHFFDSINPSNLGFHWPLEISTVRVDHHPNESAQSSAQAIIVLHWKNWVGAWFENLSEYLAGKAALNQGFAAVKKRGSSGYSLVDGIIGVSHQFIADQQGLAAQWLSQRVVKHAMNDFLGQQIEDVDDTTQRALFAHLQVASEQLRPESRGTLAAVENLNGKIDKVGGINSGLLEETRTLHSEMLARASAIEQVANEINSTKVQFDQQYQTFNQQYGSFNISYQDFNSRQSAIRTELDAFQSNYSRFTTDYGQFNQNIGQFQRDLSAFHTERIALNRDVVSVKSSVNQMQIDVGSLKASRGPVGGG